MHNRPETEQKQGNLSDSLPVLGAVQPLDPNKRVFTGEGNPLFLDAYYNLDKYLRGKIEFSELEDEYLNADFQNESLVDVLISINTNLSQGWKIDEAETHLATTHDAKFSDEEKEASDSHFVSAYEEFDKDHQSPDSPLSFTQKAKSFMWSWGKGSVQEREQPRERQLVLRLNPGMFDAISRPDCMENNANMRLRAIALLLSQDQFEERGRLPGFEEIDDFQKLFNILHPKLKNQFSLISDILFSSSTSNLDDRIAQLKQVHLLMGSPELLMQMVTRRYLQDESLGFENLKRLWESFSDINIVDLFLSNLLDQEVNERIFKIALFLFLNIKDSSEQLDEFLVNCLMQHDHCLNEWLPNSWAQLTDGYSRQRNGFNILESKLEACLKRLIPFMQKIFEAKGQDLGSFVSQRAYLNFAYQNMYEHIYKHADEKLNNQAAPFYSLSMLSAYLADVDYCWGNNKEQDQQRVDAIVHRTQDLDNGTLEKCLSVWLPEQNNPVVEYILGFAMNDLHRRECVVSFSVKNIDEALKSKLDVCFQKHDLCEEAKQRLREERIANDAEGYFKRALHQYINGNDEVLDDLLAVIEAKDLEVRAWVKEVEHERSDRIFKANSVVDQSKEEKEDLEDNAGIFQEIKRKMSLPNSGDKNTNDESIVLTGLLDDEARQAIEEIDMLMADMDGQPFKKHIAQMDDVFQKNNPENEPLNEGLDNDDIKTDEEVLGGFEESVETYVHPEVPEYISRLGFLAIRLLETCENKGKQQAFFIDGFQAENDLQRMALYTDKQLAEGKEIDPYYEAFLEKTAQEEEAEREEKIKEGFWPKFQRDFELYQTIEEQAIKEKQQVLERQQEEKVIKREVEALLFDIVSEVEEALFSEVSIEEMQEEIQEEKIEVENELEEIALPQTPEQILNRLLNQDYDVESLFNDPDLAENVYYELLKRDLIDFVNVLQKVLESGYEKSLPSDYHVHVIQKLPFLIKTHPELCMRLVDKKCLSQDAFITKCESSLEIDFFDVMMTTLRNRHRDIHQAMNDRYILNLRMQLENEELDEKKEQPETTFHYPVGLVDREGSAEMITPSGQDAEWVLGEDEENFCDGLEELVNNYFESEITRIIENTHFDNESRELKLAQLRFYQIQFKSILKEQKQWHAGGGSQAADSLKQGVYDGVKEWVRRFSESKFIDKKRNTLTGFFSKLLDKLINWFENRNRTLESADRESESEIQTQGFFKTKMRERTEQMERELSSLAPNSQLNGS
ncbi:MAG: hypothetical protein ACE365_02510 [Gammaproteobacteria bacterium]